MDSIWVNESREVSSYDPDGRITEYEFQQWIDQSWVSNYAYLYEYDMQGNLTDLTSRLWDGTTWHFYAHWHSVFDAEHRIICFLSQRWYGTGWVNQSLDSARFDIAGHQTHAVHMGWGGTSWTYVNKIDYTFDSSGNQTLKVAAEWNGITWVNQKKDSVAYDTAGHQSFHLTQVWDFDMWRWKNSGRMFYLYDSLGREVSWSSDWWNETKWMTGGRLIRSYDKQGHCISWYSEAFTPDGWTLVEGREYSFDAVGQLTSETIHSYSSGIHVRDSYAFDGAGRQVKHVNQRIERGSWANQSMDTYIYDEEGDLIINTRFMWSISSWAELYRYVSTWQGTTDVQGSDVPPPEFQLFANYPNPFNPSTTISYSLPEQSWVTLTVYDASGREVSVLVNGTEPPGRRSVVFDGSGCSSGAYFYRLVAGSHRAAGKLLLLR